MLIVNRYYFKYSKYRMPEKITVEIPPPEGNENGDEIEAETKGKTVTVEIIKQPISRNYLCGYKNKRTGKTYLFE